MIQQEEFHVDLNCRRETWESLTLFMREMNRVFTFGTKGVWNISSHFTALLHCCAFSLWFTNCCEPGPNPCVTITLHPQHSTSQHVSSTESPWTWSSALQLQVWHLSFVFTDDHHFSCDLCSYSVIDATTKVAKCKILKKVNVIYHFHCVKW